VRPVSAAIAVRRTWEHAMTGADRVVCQAAALLLLFSLSTAPAKAQFGGFGGAGGDDMMTQMAPMLEMMKAKMGKRRFGMMMQTMGPMMSRMMDNGGGFGGMMGGMPSGGGGGFAGGQFGGMSGGFGGMGGGDIMGMLGSGGGSEIMSMIPQLMRMANVRGGHRRHRRR